MYITKAVPMCEDVLKSQDGDVGVRNSDSDPLLSDTKT